MEQHGALAPEFRAPICANQNRREPGGNTDKHTHAQSDTTPTDSYIYL
jgi:hypothetical protein